VYRQAPSHIEPLPEGRKLTRMSRDEAVRTSGPELVENRCVSLCISPTDVSSVVVIICIVFVYVILK